MRDKDPAYASHPTKRKRLFSFLALLLVLLNSTILQASAQEVTGQTRQFFVYLNQFLLGFRAATYMPSMDKCANYIEYSVGDFNRTY